MLGVDYSIWRGALLVAVVAGGFLAWRRGERCLRGIKPAVGWESVVEVAVTLWRTVMLTLGCLAIVAAIGLWWSQDASNDAADTADELCESAREWQQATLANRVADVRIVEAEIRIAQQEKVDADAALAEARRIVGDRELNETEQFFIDGYEADTIRANSQLVELRREETLRNEGVTILENVALSECEERS